MSYRREKRAPRMPQSEASAGAEQLMRDAMQVANIPRVTRSDSAPARPSVTLSLREDGGLQIDIDGEVLPRSIALHNDDSIAISTIRRILLARGEAQRAIGLDGAPTQAQVKRWARQVVLPDAAGRDAAGRARSAPEKKTITPRGKLAIATTKTAEELGL